MILMTAVAEALCPRWKTGLLKRPPMNTLTRHLVSLDVQFLGWGVGHGITEKDPVKTGFYPCTMGFSPSRDLAGSSSGAEASLITLKGAP